MFCLFFFLRIFGSHFAALPSELPAVGESEHSQAHGTHDLVALLQHVVQAVLASARFVWAEEPPALAVAEIEFCAFPVAAENLGFVPVGLGLDAQRIVVHVRNGEVDFHVIVADNPDVQFKSEGYADLVAYPAVDLAPFFAALRFCLHQLWPD